jgi:hypothetical protein
LTAIAVEGFGLLADALGETQRQTDDFLEMGVTYVGFAVGNPAHFAVMFRPELYRADDPELIAAKARTIESLYRGALPFATSKSSPDSQEVALAAWSLVHGFVTLWLSGNLPTGLPVDPQQAARGVASVLFSRQG